MGKIRGRGRPKLPKGTSKATVVTVRLQPAERKAMLAAAKMADLSLSDWLRSAALLKIAEAVKIEKRKVAESNHTAGEAAVLGL